MISEGSKFNSLLILLSICDLSPQLMMATD